MEITLSDYDSRIMDIYETMYPIVKCGTTGRTWWIKSPDHDEDFSTYKSFMRFITEEIKETLLAYAVNGELKEWEEV